MMEGGGLPEGDPPGGWQRVPPEDNDPLAIEIMPEMFDNSNGLEVNLYPDGELQIPWINRFGQLLSLRSLVNWLGDDVQMIKAYATNGFREKYFRTDELTEETMERLNTLTSIIGFEGTYERVSNMIYIIFTRIK
jgi:hypothetical protein